MDKYTRKPNCTCKECNKEIYRRPAQIAKGDVFCSIKCASIRQFKPKICPICNNEFSSRRNAKTCSRICSNKSRTGISYKVGQPNNKATKSQRLKVKLLKLYPPKCNRCPFDLVAVLQVHHILERCNGGTDELNNLELLCPNCHTTHHYLTKTSMRD